VLRNGPTWIRDGRFGGAIEFDGVDDLVEVPHDPAFLLDALTVALWFRVDDPLPVQGLVSKDSNTFDDGGHFTIFVTDRKVTWRLQSEAASYSCSSPEGSIQADTWYHVAASFGPGGMELFLDGVLVSINPYPGGLGTTSGGTGNEEPWSFGVVQWLSGDHTVDGWLKPLRGAMDDIQVFSTHLTIEDFEQIGGSRVDLEWTDASDREIPPRLAGRNFGGRPAPHDSMGFFGVESGGGISSSTTFDRWFRDVLGTNMSTVRNIVLTRNEEDVYEFLTDAFYPLDGDLLGNEGDPHNYYFTYAFTTTFDYHPGSGQFIEFEGGDGAWMFIDGRLVMDLGGVESSVRQYVEMDRLGLRAGAANPHTVRFFYAHRSAGESVFRLRTNIELSGSTPAGFQISGGFD
jgi:fibro-slime domain-containing protein